MPQPDQPSFQEKLHRLLTAVPTWSARAVIHVTALAAIAAFLQSTTGVELPASLATIIAALAPLGIESVGHLLGKFDRGDTPSPNEIRETLEQAITQSGIEQALTREDFQLEMAEVFRQFDVLGGAIGTALALRETSIVRRILAGMAHYQHLGAAEIIAGVADELAECFARLDPRITYLSNLIKELETRRGLLEYVDLAGQADAPDERAARRRRRARRWEPEFVELDRDKIDMHRREAEKIPLKNIREAVEKHDCFVLIGDPGGGKTTTLRRLALDAALAGLENPEAPLPLLIELPSWRDEPGPADLVHAHWPGDFLGDPTTALFRGEVRLYLDGLNEMGAAGPNKARLLRDWLHGEDAPRHAILTCRVDDYYGGQLALGLPVVQVEALDEERIRQFAVNYLEGDAARFLARVLPRPDWDRESARHLFHLARNPYLLAALICVFEDSPDGDLPTNPGALFEQLVRLLWRREDERNTPGWQPLEAMQTAFSVLAYAMIDQKKPLEVPLEWALEQVGDAQLLRVGHSASLLELRGEQMRFYHQLMQEYFVALALKGKGLDEVLEPPRFRRFWREAGRWDQVIVALCGIVDDADAIVQQIAEVDPFLAAICLQGGVAFTSVPRQAVITRLLETLHAPEGYVRMAAAEALGKTCTEATPGLLEMLRDPKEDVREAAAWALGEIGAVEAVSGLLEMLHDPKEDVRWTAVEALARIGAAEAVSGLLEALHDPVEVVRKEAANVLGRIGAAEAVPGVLEMLHDPKEGVRWVAVRALGRIGAEEAVPGLLEALRDPKERVRRMAAWALGRIGAEEAVPGLLETLNDTVGDVREAAAWALGEIGATGAVPGLLEALRGPERDVRRAVAEALGAIGAAEAVPGLLEALRDPDWFVCRVAADALERISTPEARAGLAEWRRSQQGG